MRYFERVLPAAGADGLEFLTPPPLSLAFLDYPTQTPLRLISASPSSSFSNRTTFTPPDRLPIFGRRPTNYLTRTVFSCLYFQRKAVWTDTNSIEKNVNNVDGVFFKAG